MTRIFLRDGSHVEYATVHRIEPKNHGGHLVEGYLSRHDPNITTEQIQRLYGGGVYDVYLIMIDEETQAARMVARERVEIPGDPLYDLDTQGQEPRPRLEHLIDQNARLVEDIAELRRQIDEIRDPPTARDREQAFREQTERDHGINQAERDLEQQQEVRTAQQEERVQEELRQMMLEQIHERAAARSMSQFNQRTEELRPPPRPHRLDVSAETRQYNRFSWAGAFEEDTIVAPADGRVEVPKPEESKPEKPKESKPKKPKRLVRKLELDD